MQPNMVSVSPRSGSTDFKLTRFVLGCVGCLASFVCGLDASGTSFDSLVLTHLVSGHQPRPEDESTRLCATVAINALSRSLYRSPKGPSIPSPDDIHQSRCSSSSLALPRI